MSNNIQIDEARIIKCLSDNDLNLKEMPCHTFERADIYKAYSEYSGRIAMDMPMDKFYVMNSEGEITFVGEINSLNSYVNKLGRVKSYEF